MSDAAPELHPECEMMHRHGYCVCTMVECIWCDIAHPPHKPCETQIARAACEAVVTFLQWGAA